MDRGRNQGYDQQALHARLAAGTVPGSVVERATLHDQFDSYRNSDRLNARARREYGLLHVED